MPDTRSYDVVAIGAHPDDIEVSMGGTCARLVREGRSVLIVDLCDGEPTRYGARGDRARQAAAAAAALGADRLTLSLHDRLIADTVEARLQVARLIRQCRPATVLTTLGSGVHPDHQAVTDIVTHGVFYARLPKWDEVPGGEVLAGTDPHEIGRLFYGHCRMEPAWSRFDVAVDVTAEYDRKMAAIRAFESVFSGDHASLVDKYSAEDRYVGSLVGVRYAEPFRARSPLLVESLGVFVPTRFG
ncbi:MAG: PIG-L family deacetylase [Vicinamibacterales bacterium]